jgi:tetratricopeptide (TPR) repeat protein
MILNTSLMEGHREASNFFVAGGPLPPGSPSYVTRPADDELLAAIRAGQLCCVFAPHHMGKSSLMLQAAHRLGQEGASPVTVDLSGFGAKASAEQLYLFILKRVKFQLELAIDPDNWWAARAASTPAQRFADFISEVILATIRGPVVLFLDGIDITLDRDFLDDLLTAIQLIYQLRETEPVYQRICFTLLGMATLSDIIGNRKEYPFNASREIYLGEFAWEETGVLRKSLKEACPDVGEMIFSRIIHWTSGHPYLTQKMCLAAARLCDRHWTEEFADGLVERVFLSNEAGIEPNLHFIEENIRTSRERRDLLNCYRQVYLDGGVQENERSLEQKRLKLLGLVKGTDRALKVRNEVYRLAFNLDWIRENMPVNWAWRIVGVAILLILLMVGALGFSIRQQQQRTTQAQSFLGSFRSATSPQERLVSLAGLFAVRGHEDEARRLFYQELSPAEQLALFDVADPRAVAEQLTTVVRGVYTDPSLENNEQGKTLLLAMARPLPKLENMSSLGAIALELEISQWVKGREYYNSQSSYQRAIEAFSVAINVNGRNPGTLFDRGLAYAALGVPNQALADLATALSLDQDWQARVQNALTGHHELYTALWRDPREYRALVALVPTPTYTPIPTATSTFTPVPTDTPVPPTPTSTLPPTAIPTAAPTATPRPRVVSPPTDTPTPGVPVGTLALLSPLSVDDPTYGPTAFEWRFVGSLPPGYGFEVRVWREGEPPAGVHNAVMDNRNGNVKNIGGDQYRLSVDIREAAGVRGRSGIYLWTVALVQVNPGYVDLGQQADPARLRFEAGGTGGDDDNGGGGGGGVGID